jgi:rhodanese-related sulfurtransferase
MTTDRSRASRLSIGRGLIAAGLLLLGSVLLKLLTPDPISPELAHRLLGVLMGAVVVAYANAAPKALSPLMQMRCDPKAEQAFRRFTGWSLTLGGLAYVAAWLIAPIEHANALSASLLASSLLLVVVRCTGGMSLARLMGLNVISPEGLHRLMEDEPVTIIDVNSPQSWAKARVPGALNLNPANYQGHDLPPDKEASVVFYCSNSLCRKAPNAALRARRMGYRNVKVMPQGIHGWVATNLPTDAGA